jgi:hypothetical protein
MLVSCVVALVIGLPETGRTVGRWLRTEGYETVGRYIGGLTSLGLVLWTGYFTLASYEGLTTPLAKTIATAPRLRTLAYRRVAEVLNASAGETDRVASAEVGALGFYYKGTILDTVGLVSPEALPYLPVPPEQRASPLTGATSVDLVRAAQPEWVVSLTGFATHGLLRSKWFAAEYVRKAAVALEQECWGSAEILIFRRAGGAP